MQLRLFNSYTRQLEEFTPSDPNRVTMYACGPTVYNYIHIGNARPAVVFSLLARLLRRLYPKLVYARNITDVDDKINTAAAAQGVAIEAITTRFADAYRQDMAALGVDPPDVEPRATAHIGEIIAMCNALISSGHAYVADGHVLFAVSSFPDYGRLSRRSADEMLAGARVEVAPYKRDAGDFVLWKPSTPELPGWDSPWGRGRPGWHIECSAMAAAHLGETIDIHAGGVDLQFPHHENEIAQSVCAHGGKTFARYWLHNGLLNLGGRKMSKSIGNITLVHELLKQYPAEALRYVLLSAQYRQPLDWSEEAVDRAVATLRRLYRTLEDLGETDAPLIDAPVPEAILAALGDDLGTPEALAQLAGIAAEARKAHTTADRRRFRAQLLGAGALLGLLHNPEGMTVSSHATNALDDAAIQRLIDDRIQAKAARDFARADAIRDELAACHVLIEDTPAGVRWRRQ